MQDTSLKSPRRALIAVLAAVSLLSFVVRELSALFVPAPGAENGEWIVTDPDGLYHARRVLRAIEGDSADEFMPIAGTDPHLDYPAGAAIPWPPYYDLLLYGSVAPFAPEEAQARRSFVERMTATWPLLFGVLTTLLVACAGALLAGLPGALVAGIYHALTPAATIYAKRGVADHHAFVAMLLALLLALLTRAIQIELGGENKDPGTKRKWLSGALCGGIAGLMLGSWVASLVYVALVDIVFGTLILLDPKGQSRALTRFGLAFHVVALLVLIPAVLDSPWTTLQPWSVVNLSQFHLAFLGVGALVFTPLPYLAGRSLRKFYPLGVAFVLAAVAALLVTFDTAAWRGIQEAFAWADRSDEFMSSIQESRPLWEAVRGGEAGGFARATSYLGLGIALLPCAWIAACILAVHSQRRALLPWIIFTPILFIQALQQTRFTDVLAIPLAVLLGLFTAWIVTQTIRRAHSRRLLFTLAAAGLCVCLLQAKSLGTVVKRIQERGFATQFVRMPRQRAARATFDWLRERRFDSARFGERPGSVLANWSRGHAIEWAAGLPTVATNFGSYLGEASWNDPGRILLETSPAEAERALLEREVRWIFVSSEFPNALPTLARAAHPGESDRFIARSAEGGASLQPAFFETLGARLMFHGTSPLENRSELPVIDFLRLVRVSPERDPRPKLARWAPKSAMNWTWERVPGALLEFAEENYAKQRIEVTLKLVVDPTLETFSWSSQTTTDESGRASLRVPYSTDLPNGQTRVIEAYAQLGPRRIELAIPESAVLLGTEVRP